MCKRKLIQQQTSGTWSPTHGWPSAGAGQGVAKERGWKRKRDVLVRKYLVQEDTSKSKGKGGWAQAEGQQTASLSGQCNNRFLQSLLWGEEQGQHLPSEQFSASENAAFGQAQAAQQKGLGWQWEAHTVSEQPQHSRSPTALPAGCSPGEGRQPAVQTLMKNQEHRERSSQVC